MLFFQFLWIFFHESLAANMNQGGVPYYISNPPGSTPNWQGTPGIYSTNFENNVEGNVEHFDVYGEVQTMYSQVYWTRNNPINLPPEIVERFKGKIMAITGYEVDQVTHAGPQMGSTSTSNSLGGFSCYPDCENGDKSVPIYNVIPLFVNRVKISYVHTWAPQSRLTQNYAFIKKIRNFYPVITKLC